MLTAGIDLGGSAVKLAVLENRELLYRAYIYNSERSSAEIIREILARHGFVPEAIALTGVGAAVFETEKLAIPCGAERVLEIEALAEGSRYLTGEENFLAVSIGTGTAFVLRRGGKTSHIGGTAFGGGALQGLSRQILGGSVQEVLSPLCGKGDLSKVDLLMGEMPSCPPTLDPTMTAANLVKTNTDTAPEDWAIGILNAVVETIGSMAYLAASGRGMDTVIFTGGPTSIPETAAILKSFESIYPLRVFVPENSDCATAIGAACMVAKSKE